MKKFPSTGILIDWLSISAKSKEFRFNKIKVIRLSFGTSVFKNIDELFYQGKRVATVTSKPYSSVINEDLIIIKFDNWLLYDARFIEIYGIILYETGGKDEKISRIDLCKDFNYFANGKHPENFIKDFVSGNVRKLTKSKFSLWGETKDRLNYDYLNIGRKGSPVNVYLYNKSKELRQVKFKSWIADQWIKSKLNVNKDVFRLEISVKKSDIGLIVKDTGEEFIFDIRHIFIEEDLLQLYKLLLYKFFRFKILTGQKNISREKDFIFFGDENPEFIQWDIINPITTNRSDKIFLKKIENLYSELRLDDLELFKSLEQLKNVFMKKKHLIRYYEDKLKPNTLDMITRPDYHNAKMKKKAIDEFIF